MRHALLFRLAVSMLAIVVLHGPDVLAADTKEKKPASSSEKQLERGRYLVTIAGCHDCHSPKVIGPHGAPVPHPMKMLSGQQADSKLPGMPDGVLGPDKWAGATNSDMTAWIGPWGVSFAANLTPDQNTGIGIWTEDMFLTALKQGKHMGAGRPILPPMPWNWYGQLPDDDLKAMFAYLKSIPAIANRVPVPLGPDGKPIEAP